MSGVVRIEIRETTEDLKTLMKKEKVIAQLGEKREPSIERAC